MSYIKTMWSDGDVITAEKLNKLENGMAQTGSVLIVHINEGTLDKTWQEIYDAMNIESIVYISEKYQEDGENGDIECSMIPIITIDNTDGFRCLAFKIDSFGDIYKYKFYANSPTEYPVLPVA